MRFTTACLTKIVSFGIFLGMTIPAGAQSLIISSDFFVTAADGISIHVHRKTADEDHHSSEARTTPSAKRSNVPILLIHGTWGDGRTWDFPGRSVMDHLASRGYDVYALDLRGMGSSDRPADYSTIDILSRVQDAVAVAQYIVANTGLAPVVVGWSQGGVITGLLAASAPQLVAGVGFFSVPADGFFVPPQFVPLLQSVIASGTDRYLPTPDLLYAVAFGLDPVTGHPTMAPDAFATFVSMSEPDSLRAVLEAVSSDFFNAALVPAWPSIQVPALVVDGAQDAVVGEDRAEALFDALGSARKQLIILPRNAHGWFLEDNYKRTMNVFDGFLSQFRRSAHESVPFGVEMR